MLGDTYNNAIVVLLLEVLSDAGLLAKPHATSCALAG